MKKRLSLLVALVMVITMFATNAFAASSLSMFADVAELNPGDTVVVTVKAPDEALSDLQFALVFDQTAFTCTKAQARAIMIDEENDISWPAATGNLVINNDTGRVGYANAYSDPLQLDSSMVLMTATFTVKDTATGGNYSFQMADFVANAGTVAADLTVKVAGPVDITTAIEVTGLSKVYNGQAQYPTINTTLAAGDYKVTYTNGSGTEVVPCNVGTYTMTITGENGNSGTITKTFTITKASQILSYATTALTKEYDAEFTNALTGHKFGTVTYTSSDESVATVDANGKVTVKAASGTATITATVAANDNYDTVSASYTVTAKPKALTVTPLAPDAKGNDTVVTLENVYKMFGFDNAADAAAAGVSFTIKYFDKNGVELAEVPSKPGTYSYIITVVPGSNFTIADATVEGSFTIKSGRPPQSGKPGSVSNFVDIDARAYYYDAVEWAVANGITEGKTYFKFAPNEACTRAQMVTFLWRAAGCPTPSGSYSKFVDVNMNKYYADAVLWAVENGITEGKTATTFAPNQACTRAQMATFLYRFAKGSANGNASGFSDVSSSKYYAPAVAWAVKNGITNGTTANTFSPNNVCTRAQMVTFLYRYFEA